MDQQVKDLNEFNLQQLRLVRDKRLSDADKLVFKAEDNGIDTSPYRQYRQQLRDITQTYQTLEDVVWPQKPSLPQASA
ncbi:hypothetical protein ABVY39_004845 [Vibrio parahaemolyticus]